MQCCQILIYSHLYTLTSKTNVDLLFDKTSWKTREFLLFNCCKLLCSSRLLRVANLQKPKMGSKRSAPSRHHSLTTYEVMFAVLFVMLVALCVGLIAVSWLSIQGSEKGKFHKVGYRKCSQVNIYTSVSRILPAFYIHCFDWFPGKVFLLHPDASP